MDPTASGLLVKIFADGPIVKSGVAGSVCPLPRRQDRTFYCLPCAARPLLKLVRLVLNVVIRDLWSLRSCISSPVTQNDECPRSSMSSIPSGDRRGWWERTPWPNEVLNSIAVGEVNFPSFEASKNISSRNDTDFKRRKATWLEMKYFLPGAYSFATTISIGKRS